MTVDHVIFPGSAYDTELMTVSQAEAVLDGAALLPYVPRLLATWPANGPAHQQVDGTLVYVDISGFTRLSERLAEHGRIGAEEITDLLNGCFERLLTIAVSYAGDLLKFGGDALLLFFTGPAHANRGCRAAAEMRLDLRRERVGAAVGVPPLKMSVGIHSGAFDFIVVEGRHRELVVTGPHATRTVSMESTAEAGEILISPETARQLPRSMWGKEKGPGILLARRPDAERLEFDPVTLDAETAQLCIPLAFRPYLGTGWSEAEHRPVVVSFIKFTGVDGLFAEQSPAAVADAISELIVIIQEAAAEMRVCFLSTDIDADGGKVILTAGAPELEGDDAERMLLTARAILEAKPALTVRIGVNLGHVFAGDVGAPFRRSYTVMGDAVNLAARVMSRAQPGQILATPEVLANSQATFDFEEQEPFFVKGKSRPVQAAAIGQVRGRRGPAREGRVRLVGRQAEVAILRNHLNAVARGEGGVVELTGDVGMGKTRLLEELGDYAAALGIPVFRAGTGLYASKSPYLAVRDMLRGAAHLDASAGDSPAALLEGRIREVAPDLLPWAPLIGVAMDIAMPSTPETEAIGLQFRRARLEQAVAEFVTASVAGPALFVFDDAHLLDDASQSLLRALTDCAPAARFLVCITRPTPGETADSTWTTMALDRLTAADANTLGNIVADSLGRSRLGLRKTIDRADGNPLFIIELVSVASRAGAEADLPSTLEAVIAARIDDLPPATRKSLREAAVIGAVFDSTLLHDSLSDVEWSALRTIVEPAGESTYRFRHRLFRDAAYEGLSYRRRRELHERVGGLIEQRSQDPAGEAELLAIHFSRALMHDRAWTYGAAAGDRARAKYATVEAAEFYRTALDSGRRLGEVHGYELARVYEALGDMLELCGELEDASSALTRASSLFESAEARLRVARKRGLIKELRGEYGQALRWLSRGMREYGRLRGDAAETSDLGETLIAYAGVRYRQGRYRECADFARRAIPLVEAEGKQGAIAHAHRLLGIALRGMGQSGRSHLERALELYEATGDLVGQARLLNNFGVDAHYSGDFTAAGEFYIRSRDAFARAGDVIGEATALNNIGEAVLDSGNSTEIASIEPYFRDALRIWRSARYAIGVALATRNLGRLAHRQGRSEDGRALMFESLDAFAAMGAQGFIAETQTMIDELAKS